MSESDRILNDIRGYLRISAAQSVKSIAVEVIDTYEKTLVYGMLDGETTQTMIEQTTRISQATISGWLASFVESGLCTQPNKYYKSHHALFTLQELGINPSVLKKRAKTPSKTDATKQGTDEVPQAGEVP